MPRSTLRSYSTATEDGYFTMIGKAVRPESFDGAQDRERVERVSKDERERTVALSSS
jgi:hypothetical protein